MPDLNDSDASATSAPSPTLALPPGPALLTSPASSEPPLAGDSTASEPDLDIPPLDPIIDPITHRRAEVERLGERIAELSSRIQAATYDLLVLIREFDAQTGWSGWTSCAHWLSWRTGLAPGAAREHVRVARALGKLPELSDAMRRGAGDRAARAGRSRDRFTDGLAGLAGRAGGHRLGGRPAVAAVTRDVNCRRGILK